MTKTLQDAQIAHVSDLLRSLKASVWSLRQSAERLTDDLAAGDTTEIGSGSKELSQSKGLVAACQKLELYLAELETERDGAGGGGSALDLDAARAEIGRRLARLRDAERAGPVSD